MLFSQSFFFWGGGSLECSVPSAGGGGFKKSHTLGKGGEQGFLEKALKSCRIVENFASFVWGQDNLKNAVSRWLGNAPSSSFGLFSSFSTPRQSPRPSSSSYAKKSCGAGTSLAISILLSSLDRSMFFFFSHAGNFFF